jgi:L-2-hydroxyglutarate oxidase LhgO
VTPRQKKRLVRNAAKGNKLKAIRMLTMQRKCTRIAGGAISMFHEGIISYTEACSQMARQMSEAVLAVAVKSAVRKLMSDLRAGGFA